MGNQIESSNSNNLLGLTLFNNVQNEVNQLLEQFYAKWILGDSPEERQVLDTEVGRLLNERLDAIEREKALKAPMIEKEIQKLRKEKMVPHIANPAIKAVPYKHNFLLIK